MLVYHVSVDNNYQNLTRTFIPRIPDSKSDNEEISLT